MIVAPYPADEHLRLRLIDRFELVEDVPDRFLDALTRTVARTFSAPICAVSIIDATRQVFRSRFGLEPRETSRDCSMCAHLLWSPAPLIVPDATRDLRFADNPLVRGSPHIRFYAGVPLHLRGICIGALCIIDHRPREHFGPQDLHLLTGAAAAVEERLILTARDSARDTHFTD